MTERDDAFEARRLERLWASRFGDDYVERNTAFDHRTEFWGCLIQELGPTSVLEVGCSIGGNLRWMRGAVERVIGVDVNWKALTSLRGELPNVGAAVGAARKLPFRSSSFDLVFTMGVLIHQPNASLLSVMGEMYRCTRRRLVVGEYFAPDTIEVPYRGQQGALFKRDYGSLFLEHFSDLRLVDSGFLGRNDGWDDITYWVLERTLEPEP
ncbi:MAG: pseudaminic acid biosynthesis-associated methylase [Acidimicrobiales bacterium]